MFKRTAERFAENDEGAKLVHSGLDDGNIYRYIEGGKSLSIGTQRSSDNKEITVCLHDELYWDEEKHPIHEEEALHIKNKLCEAFACFDFKVKMEIIPKPSLAKGLE